METRTIQQIADACGGALPTGAPALAVNRLVTDTRGLAPGDAFLALRGERFDGHDFLAEAVAAGAVALIVEAAHLARVPAGIAVIVVENTRLALGRIAAWYRNGFEIPVVAVGGSNGKTSTKEMIAALLRARHEVQASEASFNNDVGVPLTLLGLSARHRAAVVEVGTNHPGELAPLVRMVRPTLGVITSLGREHMEFFGSLDGVIEEEGWLAELLPAKGTLVVNSDAPGIDRVLARTRARVIRIGTTEQADWRMTSSGLNGRGMHFEVNAPTPEFSGGYTLPAYGRHQTLNATLALAVAAELGLSRSDCERGLTGFCPPKRRLQLLDLAGVAVLDDCYNANADSMGAALEVLRLLPCRGRRVAVLGDMAELGPSRLAAHAEVGSRAAAVAEELYAVGTMASVMAQAARAAGLRGVHEFTEIGAAADALASSLKPGDLVLVKASRSARFERVVEHVRQRRHPGGSDTRC